MTERAPRRRRRSPVRAIPSVGVAVDGDHLAQLRALDPPIVARVQDGRTVLDLRTVEPDDDHLLVDALGAITAGPLADGAG